MESPLKAINETEGRRGKMNRLQTFCHDLCLYHGHDLDLGLFHDLYPILYPCLARLSENDFWKNDAADRCC